MPRKTRKQKQHADQYRGGPAIAIASALDVLASPPQLTYEFQGKTPKHTQPPPAAASEAQAIQRDLIKTVVLSSAMISVIVALARVW